MATNTKPVSLRSKRHDDERLAKLEWLLMIPMVATVGVLMICLLLPYMTDLTDGQQAFVKTVEWGTWVIFILEYGVRFVIASDKRRYVRQNLIDLGVIAIPLLSLVIPWCACFSPCACSPRCSWSSTWARISANFFGCAMYPTPSFFCSCLSASAARWNCMRSME